MYVAILTMLIIIIIAYCDFAVKLCVRIYLRINDTRKNTIRGSESGESQNTPFGIIFNAWIAHRSLSRIHTSCRDNNSAVVRGKRRSAARESNV